ncbi:MAG: type II toxin-antitoxin system VapC family toxin [Acidimicrobiia bacterium]
MSRTILDASALLTLLLREAGADQVIEALPEAAISAVNLSEAIGKLADAGMPEPVIRHSLGVLPLEVVPFEEEQAYRTGFLQPSTKGAGLSLGDRVCLALAISRGVRALTADRAWLDVDVGAELTVIR